MLREAANATRALPLQFVWCETESEFTQARTPPPCEGPPARRAQR